jgi:hypothetical protein
MYYKETLSDVLVFKTSICETDDLEKVAAVIEHDPRILKWNVDRDDVDKVLRIEANHISSVEVKSLVNAAGYYCEELPD